MLTGLFGQVACSVGHTRFQKQAVDFCFATRVGPGAVDGNMWAALAGDQCMVAAVDAEPQKTNQTVGHRPEL